MASFVTNSGADGLTSGGTITFSSDTIKVRLVTSTSTVNKDDTNMSTWIAIGTDQTLGSKTKTKDTTNDRIVFDAADATWTAVAGGSTIGGLGVFKFVTNDAGSTPITFIDVTDTPTNGSDIVWTISADGMFYLQE